MSPRRRRMAKLRESLGTLERMSAENKVQQDRSNILQIVLVALAVFASVAMLFTNSTAVMKVAVLAALWAAFFGLLLVSRYRRQYEKQKTLLEEQYDRHEAELELEKAAHREQELRLEQTLRKTLMKEEDNRLDDIRDQLTVVREQLEELNGRSFDYEPTALRASAMRMDDMAELSGPVHGPSEATEDDFSGLSSYGASSYSDTSYGDTSSYGDSYSTSAYDTGYGNDSYSGDDSVTEVEYTEAEYTSTQYATNAFSSSYAASNYSMQGSGGTASSVRSYATTKDSYDDYDDSGDFSYDSDFSSEDYLDEPSPAPEPSKRFDTTAFAAVQWKPANTEPKVEPTPAPMNDSRRGRRRRDENSEAPSVADLLKNFNRNS